MKEGKSKMHMLHFCFTFDFIGGRLTYSQEVTVIGWEIGVDSALLNCWVREWERGMVAAIMSILLCASVHSLLMH